MYFNKNKIKIKIYKKLLTNRKASEKHANFVRKDKGKKKAI